MASNIGDWTFFSRLVGRGEASGVGADLFRSKVGGEVKIIFACFAISRWVAFKEKVLLPGNSPIDRKLWRIVEIFTLLQASARR